MTTLQETKRRVAGAGVGIVLALSMAAAGFAAPAFADTADTDVFLRADKSGTPIEGTDYDITVPSGGIIGTVDSKSGAITYNTIAPGTKDYSVEIENKSLLPIKVDKLSVTDQASFNYELSSAISTATAPDSLATTIAPSTNTSAKVEIANAEAAAVTPTGVGWDSIASGATQGYVFADGAVKNLTKTLPDTSSTGLKAYTVEWTVEFA